MRTTLFQPCNEANVGAGCDPLAECHNCLGRGFFYDRGWALTCPCKNPIEEVRQVGGIRQEGGENPKESEASLGSRR